MKMAKNTMPSAKAVLRIAWTRIGVAAPGFRPTADEAPIPMRPTPTAAPRAARPTWMLPLISARMVAMFMMFPFSLVVVPDVPRGNHGLIVEIVFYERLVMLLLVLADE